MNSPPSLRTLIERYFTDRLTRQQHARGHTIASYRDTFRLLLRYASRELRRSPSDLEACEIGAALICDFLDSLETVRSSSAHTRNLRLIAPTEIGAGRTQPSSYARARRGRFTT
jgi:hypothetical protein